MLASKIGSAVRKEQIMDVNEFIGTLGAILQENGVECAVVPGEEIQIGDTLRALVPVTEENDQVLMEVMVAPCDEDVLIVQLFSTIIPEIGPGYEALKDEILDWNLVCPFGSFGICRQLRQFYHKYVLLVTSDKNALDLAGHVARLLSMIAVVIEDHYADAVRISANN